MRIIQLFSELLRAFVPAVFLGLLGFAVWFGFEQYYPLLALKDELREKDQQLAELTADLELKDREIERLDTALRLMKVDHRVAQMAVVDQWQRPDQVIMTKLAFAEVNEQGDLLDGYKSFTIEGNVVYIDTWVAKFLDEHVENGVPLRSTSICLFRRLFGEHQRPHDGFPLDTVGSSPAAYRGATEMSDLERNIWANFWQYANDPAKAQSIGLRALQGEAPSIRLAKGKVYWVFLRASDGLTIKVTDHSPPPAASDHNVQAAGYSAPVGY